MTILTLRSVSHRFHSGTWGLRGIDLEIADDEFILIAGKNGSGKTLLMLHLVGLLSPTEGVVEYRGKPVGTILDEVRARVGIVFQDSQAQILGQTVREDVGFGLEYTGLSASLIEERTDWALDRMSIRHLERRRPLFLSGGEQRKMSLAGLLAREAEVLVLDEPFIGLDLPGVRSIISALVELRSAGHTVVVISHDVGKVLAHCDRLVVMEAGRIVEDGPPATIVDRLERYEVRRPPGAVESMSWLS